jgi:general secretion pathway protein A
MSESILQNSLQEMLSYFSLQNDPFGRDIETSQLLRLPLISEALMHLDFFCERRGIGILTGKSGSGKSCLLRLLVSRLPAGMFRPVYLCHSSVSVGEFYGHVATAFNLPARGRKASLFRSIKEHVYQLQHTEKIHPLLIIDEAHALSNDILMELRQLLNFQYDSETCLSILLCGQDEILSRLRLSILEPLANSITTTVTMKPLSLDETGSYLEERVKLAGGQRNLFSPQAVRAIHNTSHGVMRLINSIASGGLIKAWRIQTPMAEAEQITSMMSDK